MEPRSGSCKVNFQQIARELDISVMTLYRVVNNQPTVRRETRARVIEALNRHGYFTHKPQTNIKVLFDFTDHEYLTHYGNRLKRNIEKLNYLCYATNHRRDPEHFFNTAAECEVAVFASVPDREIIDRTRQANPDIYTITISTKSNADVTLSPDNTRGSEIAARHLHGMGHRHVAVYMAESHATRFERYKAFYAEMKFLDPNSQIDIIYEPRKSTTRVTLNKYFNRTAPWPSAIFFLAGEFAENFNRDMIQKDPERFSKLSIMTYDRPQDLEFRINQYNFDRIEFNSPDLLDWAEYYITNRPMMKKRSPIHTNIDVHLVTTGSVKKLEKKS